jgi:signal transduction histidine kinase
LRDDLAKGGGIAMERVEATERREEGLLASEQSLTLVAGVRHDLANLLGAILVECDLMGFEPLPDVVRSEVEVIAALARRAVGVSQRLAAIGRPLRLERLDVSALVHGLRPVLDRLVGPGVVVDLHLADGLSTILGDPVELERAIINLALNARDAMAGRGRLTVETRSAAGSRVAISLTDEGLGIDPAHRDRLFDRALEAGGDGPRGHGLAVIARAVALHHGTVRVEGPAAGGSRFVIELPPADAVAAAPVRPLARGSSPPG